MTEAVPSRPLMLEHPENGGPVRQTTLGYSVVDRGSIRIKEDA